MSRLSNLNQFVKSGIPTTKQIIKKRRKNLSRLDLILRWTLEPAHTSRTHYLIDTPLCVIGTSISDSLVHLSCKDASWQRIGCIGNKELIQLTRSLCHV